MTGPIIALVGLIITWLGIILIMQDKETQPKGLK